MKRSRGSSGEIIGSNESMLSLIFLRLPVKSLIRFKSVCKQWFSLVSDPFFAHKHTITSLEKNHSFLTPSGLFILNSFDSQISSVSLSKTRKRIKPSLPSLSFLGHNFKILQSCNGLLLCRLSCGTICICNPTTGKFKILPSATVDGEFSWISPFTVAFNPSRSPNYRVVCFKRFKKEVPESTGSYYFQIFIYSSETGFWKASTCFEVNVCSDMASGIFSNGSIHWQCHEQYIRFDMNEEKVRLMTLPFVYWNHRFSSPIGYLGQWCDNVYSCMKNDLTWNLYEPDQGTLDWTKKYKIDAYRISRLASNVVNKERQTKQHQYVPGESRWSVLAIAKGENEMNTIVLLAIFGKVFSYNLLRRKVKIILDLGLPSDVEGNVCRNCLGAYQFVETLSPV